MRTILRKAFGALLAYQCAGMLAFDLWLWTGDLDVDQMPFDDAAMFLGFFLAESAGLALGLWLVFRAPRNDKPR